MNLTPLDSAPRLLMECRLEPAQGHRFQPTGFPDLGAASYTLPDGKTDMVLVESAQSMANRLEAVCWDTAENALVPVLKGLPYVEVETKMGPTNTILEAHRLNSPYIVEHLKKDIVAGAGYSRTGAVDIRKFAATVLRLDPNSLLHGLFLSNVEDGRLRLSRLLSAFIEAKRTVPATSGGVKFDRLAPKGNTNKGFGHVPFHRQEYTAEEITAYFNLDLHQLRAYGLGSDAERLMILLALYKFRRFLREGLRLRTACDLVLRGAVEVKAPAGFQAPTLEEIEQALPGAIQAVAGAGLFANPAVTRIGATK